MLAKSKTESELAVQKYVKDVLSGKIVTCDYVKLAIKRYVDDLEHAGERGFHFDKDAANKNIDFCAELKHSKGKWAGQAFILEPWQMFIRWNIFGWMREDGTRRFRKVYEEIGRKNGKTTDLAAIGLYGLGFDGEGGAEVYSVATKEEQARLTFGEGQRMAKKSGNLGGMAVVHTKSIFVDSTDSAWKPLGKDSKYQDGLNPHFTLVDEYHAHPDSSMLDVMDSGIGARSQPLIYIITTAGFNRHCACYSERNYALKVLTGTVVDDAYFAIIYTLDDGDDWKDESVWIKANPNLGITVSLDDMQRMKREALESPAKINNFLTKKCNIWTTQTVKWVNLEKWDACNEVVDESLLVGKSCFGGLDLSANKDITAAVWLFPWDDEKYVVIPRFWIPQDRAKERARQDKAPYLEWAEQGLIKMTPGNVIDYNIVIADIVEDCSKFGVDSIAFDRWAFEPIRQRLMAEGIPEDKMIAFGMGWVSMSAPMKELENIYLSGRLIHNNNPVLRWMAENVAARTDPAGNISPDKENSSEKIDGIVALIEAVGLAITKEIEISVYEDRGVLTV